jgi:PAS domain S-box-containing protein
LRKGKLDDLRQKAEETLAKRESQIERLDQADLKSLAHELAVHQVELEIQNEELRLNRLEAEKSRDRYLDLFDFAPVAYFTLDEHNRIVEANLTACQLLKTDRRNLLNKSFTKYINPEESEKFYLQRRKVLESGTRQTGELQMQTVEGTPFYAQIESLRVGEEKLRLAVMDVTERKKAGEALKESEQRYRSLFENMIDGYAYCQMIFENNQPQDFIYAAVNKSFEKLTGLKDVTGRKVTEVIPRIRETNPELFEIYGRVALTGQPERFETYLEPLKIWFSISVYSMKKGTFTAVFENITERKKAEESLKQYTTELESSNKELEAFSYSVSHDLRQPLRALDGFSWAVIEGYADKLDEQGKDYLDRVRKASQHMSELINDLLKLSRIARADIHFQNVNVSEIAQSIMEELKNTQPERKAEFMISPGIIVKGDKSLLTIALQNLLGNAWKFTSKCPQARIEFGVILQNGEKVFFVRDNGIGFNMQYSDKLFQPFQRLHSGKEYEGTGIGLATAQRIIRRHGGIIWADSEKGKGATFYFKLGEKWN